jgi:hypothetical protein
VRASKKVLVRTGVKISKKSLVPSGSVRVNPDGTYIAIGRPYKGLWPIGQYRWPLLVAIPDEPGVIERGTAAGVLNPLDTAGEDNLLGERRTASKQVCAALGVVKVRPQEHGDHAGERQGSFDKLGRTLILDGGLVMMASVGCSVANQSSPDVKKSSPSSISVATTWNPADSRTPTNLPAPAAGSQIELIRRGR